MMRRFRPWLYSALAGVVLVFALEILLRLALPTMPYEILVFHPVLGYCPAAEKHLQAVTGLFSPEGCDPTGLTHTITTNAVGERVVPASRPDQPRSLIVLGDSCTYGWDVSDDETFANRLAELANAADSGLSVRLLAVPGYSSLEGYILYQLRVQSPPDIAVIAFGANDEDPVDATPWRGGLTDHELHGFSDGQYGEVPTSVRWRMLLGKLQLMTLVTRARGALGGDQELAGDGLDLKRRLTPYQTGETLDSLVQLLRSQGVAVLVHNLCSCSRSSEVRSVATAHGVPFIDTDMALTNEWRVHLSGDEIVQVEEEAEGLLGAQCLASHPEMFVTTDDFHPNVYGNRVIGDVLWPHVEEALSALDSPSSAGAR